MPYVWRKLEEGEHCSSVSPLCGAKGRMISICLLGQINPSIRLHLVCRLRPWHPRAEGFIGLVQGLINPLLGFLSLASCPGCTGTHWDYWLCWSGFQSSPLRRRQCYTSRVSEGLTGSDKEFLAKLLSKEFFTVASRWHSDKPRGLYFLSLPSFTLSICSFCRST